MNVDLSHEFEGISDIEFDSVPERNDFVRHKMIEGMVQIVNRAMEWLIINHPELCSAGSRFAETEFYEANLMAQFAKRVSTRALMEWNREIITTDKDVQ